jgi:diguanylate cyclase (GGDEF)-like protein
VEICAIKAASKSAKRFVVAVCLIIIALEAWSSWHERRTATDEAFRSTANMVVALTQHADQALDEVDIVLKAALEQVGGNGQMPMDRTRLHNFLVQNVSDVPQLAGLFIYDEKGAWVASSQPVLETRFNNSDRDYFIHHKQQRFNTPFIGKPVRSKSTGHWILTMSRRIDKPDGTFGGVVLATLDINFFERFYHQFDIGKKGAILFGTNEATVLYRRPLLVDSMGKVLTESPLFQQHIKLADSGAVEIRSTQDGELRINSFKHLSHYPLFVIVAVSKDEVLHNWTRHAIEKAVGISFLLLAVCYGGSKMVTQVALRERAQAEAVTARQNLERMFQLLQVQSRRDGLTGTINRRYFDELLDSEVARFGRSGGAISLLMIDVDHFKKYNDSYGHVAGDQCLQKVATAIAEAARREVDVVARYGGEEFAVLLPACGREGATVVAERICAAVRTLAITHPSSEDGVVSVSVGISAIESDKGFTFLPREIVEAADKALYVAKENGRGRAVYREFTLRPPVLVWSA